MNLEQARAHYQHLWETALPGSVAEGAYGAIIGALDAKTLLDAKNNLHVYELMSTPGEAQNLYHDARMELERELFKRA